ncbi:hypothetical protein CA54_12720 [Symmachiella macrocystis]|uniref:Uncharacterized protein n=1 Tax=Symmachiella macrocystis TaxID=2527985 RepID=A0A5C6BK40_9PLAN|nr:hypothetical protein [Symmachiella macrocystis]TWU12448.1 hypothetical protein CA54_12720 [Symmachiella macrocystis]
MNLELLIFCGGMLHFGILIASALVPQVLDWKSSLAKLDSLSRQLVWVHGAFIVLVIVGFGLLSLFCAGELASGTHLARGVCLFIAIFWGARLGVQFFVFDAKSYLTTTFLKIGYHGLTVAFLYITIVFALAAWHPL